MPFADFAPSTVFMICHLIQTDVQKFSIILLKGNHKAL